MTYPIDPSMTSKVQEMVGQKRAESFVEVSPEEGVITITIVCGDPEFKKLLAKTAAEASSQALSMIGVKVSLAGI